jgi:hypothetical protein
MVDATASAAAILDTRCTADLLMLRSDETGSRQRCQDGSRTVADPARAS